MLLALLIPGIAVAGSTDHQGGDSGGVRPIVIGHRGTAGYRPEHTLASYRLAIDLGADYIEPDLVSTKDHQLVARHEPDITATTDVANHPEFASRKTTKVIDGVSTTGWFTDDFTLAELRTLRANGLDRPGAKVFIQSFEVGNLQRLRGMTRLPLVQLLDATGKPFDFVVSGDPRTYADLAKPAGLAEIARYAQGIGPNKDMIVPRSSTNHLLTPTSLVADAHRAGLLVHPFTFRNENTFLPEDFRQGNPASPEYLRARGDSPAEFRLFFGLDVDGVFTDDSDMAVATRAEMFGSR